MVVVSGRAKEKKKRFDSEIAGIWRYFAIAKTEQRKRRRDVMVNKLE